MNCLLQCYWVPSAERPKTDWRGTGIIPEMVVAVPIVTVSPIQTYLTQVQVASFCCKRLVSSWIWTTATRQPYRVRTIMASSVIVWLFGMLKTHLMRVHHVCTPCNEFLALEHVLLHCMGLAEIRERCHTCLETFLHSWRRDTRSSTSCKKTKSYIFWLCCVRFLACDFMTWLFTLTWLVLRCVDNVCFEVTLCWKYMWIMFVLRWLCAENTTI